MTLALLGAGALVAAAGTRMAALLFLAAGVVGAPGLLATNVSPTMAAVATWTAVTAAGMVALPDTTPRRIALPALGAAAALAAGSVRNTAAVGVLWVIGTAAAVLSRGGGAGGSRWAATLCLTDVPVMAALIWTALGVGLEGWPQQMDGPGIALLLLAVVPRVALASGPGDDAPAPGLLTVRAQTLVLLAVVVGTSGVGREALLAVAVLGAAGFALGSVMARGATVDVVQEIALVAVVAGATRLGWAPAGWEWGVLAAGSLIHNLRLRVDGPGLGSLPALILRGGGVGLPFLPAILVGLEGSARAGDWSGLVVMAGLVAGLAGRARWPAPAQTRATGGPGGLRAAVAGAAVAASIVGALWAPVFTVPSGTGASAIGWPPVWAAVSVAAAAAVWSLRPVAAPETRRGPARVLPELRLPPAWSRPTFVAGVLGSLGAVSVAIWFVGAARGFL